MTREREATVWIFSVIGYATLALLVTTYPAFRVSMRKNGNTGVASEISLPIFYGLFFGPLYYGAILAVTFVLHF
jgi:hypothetical protein